MEATGDAVKNKQGRTVTVSREHHKDMSSPADAELRLCEERLHSILELSTEWYWEQDAQYRFTLFLGTKPEAPSGDPQTYVGATRWDHGAVPVGDGGNWDRHKAALDARESFHNFVFRRANPRGEVCYICTSGQPVFEGMRFIGYRGIARDATASMRAEQLQRLEHMVARCVAGTDSASAALEAVIRSVCETQSWECGRYFSWDDAAGVLGFNQFWHVPCPDLARFIDESRQITYASGVGLIGEGFRSGQPAWVPDIASDKRLKRGIARAAGMRGTCLFPVISEGRPIGVLSFHSRNVREPDERLLQAMGVVGSQIGQFLQRKQAEARIEYLATHDGLTALPNRTLFSQLLNGAVRSAQRYVSSFAVLFIDLDGFKSVNDTLGHGAGDRLLQEMAKRFADCMRSSDIVARLGGDEFVVLVQEASEEEQVTAVSHKILAAAGEPVALAGQQCQVTASIGICMFPADAQDEQSLMKNADAAMYLAKGRGKNNIQFYSESLKKKSGN